MKQKGDDMGKTHPIIMVLLLALAAPLTALHADEGVTLSLPPASLAKWYKPANKRQVWLHTMFELRRSMQAVGEYAALEDRPRLEKWARRFAEHYGRIAEMVPEWKDELEPKWADRLVEAAAKGETSAVQTALHRLGTTCRSCHRQYRPVVAALYRAPDFRQITVEFSDTLEEVPYHDVMEDLSASINRIRIAMEDGRQESARAATDRLTLRLQDLANNCSTCHTEAASRDRIMGAGLRSTLEALTAGVDAQQPKEVGRLLGEIGFGVCSRCHGVHRTLADLRGTLLPAD